MSNPWCDESRGSLEMCRAQGLRFRGASRGLSQKLALADTEPERVDRKATISVRCTEPRGAGLARVTSNEMSVPLCTEYRMEACHFGSWRRWLGVLQLIFFSFWTVLSAASWLCSQVTY